jgi:hypothetical protein
MIFTNAKMAILKIFLLAHSPQQEQSRSPPKQWQMQAQKL